MRIWFFVYQSTRGTDIGNSWLYFIYVYIYISLIWSQYQNAFLCLPNESRVLLSFNNIFLSIIILLVIIVVSPFFNSLSLSTLSSYLIMFRTLFSNISHSSGTDNLFSLPSAFIIRHASILATMCRDINEHCAPFSPTFVLTLTDNTVAPISSFQCIRSYFVWQTDRPFSIK